CYTKTKHAGKMYAFNLLCFKWFSSLTNLTFRRSTEKSDSKSALPKPDVAEVTVDDMGAMRPRTASYARSSESYTHMGTLPRLLMKNRAKNVSPSSGLTETLQEGTCDGQGIMPAGPAEAPEPLRETPPPSVTHGTEEEAQPEEDATTMGTESQPTASEPPGPEEGGKDILFSSLQFSKEKYLLESPPEKLRKELEEELRLSPADIRSHGWYHGHIPREVSETLVLRNGDFLVRDSLTSVGDYVLTCRWDNEVLHFKISKVLVKSNETKVQYVLESDSFDSVQELVRFYVGQRRPVSQPSGVHIYCPVSRTLPLRYLEATFALSNSKQGSAYSPSSQRGAYIKRRSVTMTDGLSTEKMMPHSPSTIHHHKDAMRNCAMSMDQIQEYRCPLSPVGETPLSPAYSASGRVLAVVPPSPVMRRSSDPQLSPSASNNPSEHPAHTSHSAHSSPAHHPSYQSHSSETAGSYCDLRPCPAAGPPKPPAKSYVERLRVEEGRDEGAREEGEGMFSTPQVETTSSFRPSRFESCLMPAENKPLEMSVLKRVKELLAEVDARTAAKHITMVDCKVARILGVTPEMQRMMGVSSGLELLTLPHGHQLRLDLLERFYTMSIMMAVDLLGCTGSTEERAALLHKTIQLAAELKSNLGNMFGFAAVMRALELPQISRLEQTWVTLRQRHTEGAILYEKKLKPFMKNMNDGKESSVLSNTSFPHIVPVLSLLERGVALGEALEPWESAEVGVDVVMCHLEAARTIAHHGGIYRTNAETKLQGFQERAEVLEIFQTEFQMRLLWGSRGSEGSQAERYEKFDKVLTALSHKLEPPVRHSEL
uniref:SH2 domain containing 3C n=1 Tax=Myripristis murdjan TaxID=586833 RepID=A0A667ZDI0_9TELE